MTEEKPANHANRSGEGETFGDRVPINLPVLRTSSAAAQACRWISRHTFTPSSSAACSSSHSYSHSPSFRIRVVGVIRGLDSSRTPQSALIHQSTHPLIHWRASGFHVVSVIRGSNLVFPTFSAVDLPFCVFLRLFAAISCSGPRPVLGRSFTAKNNHDFSLALPGRIL